MPIVKNAIQAVVPRNIIAIATATKNDPNRQEIRSSCFSSLGRSTPTWAFLRRSPGRGYVGERRPATFPRGQFAASHYLDSPDPP